MIKNWNELISRQSELSQFTSNDVLHNREFWFNYRRLLYCQGLLRPLIDTIDDFSCSDLSIMIIGDEGSGKWALAHLIHAMSPYWSFPFLFCRNCAQLVYDQEGLFFHSTETGLPSHYEFNLIEEDEKPKITLYLENIDTLPGECQLRLLEILKLENIGHSMSKAIRGGNLRFLASIRKTPRELFTDSILRKDLFYSLAVVTLFVPGVSFKSRDVERYIVSMDLPEHYFAEEDNLTVKKSFLKTLNIPRESFHLIPLLYLFHEYCQRLTQTH